jgi:hypothetical protein
MRPVSFYLRVWLLMEICTVPLSALWQYWDLLGSSADRIAVMCILDLYIFYMMTRAYPMKDGQT